MRSSAAAAEQFSVRRRFFWASAFSLSLFRPIVARGSQSCADVVGRLVLVATGLYPLDWRRHTIRNHQRNGYRRGDRGSRRVVGLSPRHGPNRLEPPVPTAVALWASRRRYEQLRDQARAGRQDEAVAGVLDAPALSASHACNPYMASRRLGRLRPKDRQDSASKCDQMGHMSRPWLLGLSHHPGYFRQRHGDRQRRM